MSPTLSYQRKAVILILGLLILRIGVLFISPLGLHGDEAQYWAWSKALDWGYFTKPPLIAWVIWTTTSVFGDAEWAVRLSSPILHALTAFVIFRTARFAFDDKTGFWAAVIYLFMPALWLSSAIVSTDVPLLLCWALALGGWLHMRRSPSWARGVQLGAGIGFGLLAKYAMFFFLAALTVTYFFDPRTRKALTSKWGLLSACLALIIFLPNIIWNFVNDFATVSHTADNANIETGQLPFYPLNLLEFLGEQFVVFGPVTFILFVIALIFALKNKSSDPSKWVALFAITPLLIISIEALLSRANANWAVTAYVAGSILTAHLGVTHAVRFKTWLRGGVIFQSLVCLGAGIILLSPALTDSVGLSNSVKRLRKWPETVRVVEDIYKKGHDGAAFQTLVLDKRIIFYDLTYYGLAQKLPMKMWQSGDKPVNHAELTAPLTAQSGPVLILNYVPHYAADMKVRFKRLEPMPDINIDLGGGKYRTMRVWAGYDYAPKRRGENL